MWGKKVKPFPLVTPQTTTMRPSFFALIKGFSPQKSIIYKISGNLGSQLGLPFGFDPASPLRALYRIINHKKYIHIWDISNTRICIYICNISRNAYLRMTLMTLWEGGRSGSLITNPFGLGGVKIETLLPRASISPSLFDVCYKIIILYIFLC